MLNTKLYTTHNLRRIVVLLSGLAAFYWLYFFFLGYSLYKIDQANSLKKTIPDLFQKEQFDEVVRKSYYLLSIDSTQADKNYWNLASAYYLLKQKNAANNYYSKLLETTEVRENQARAWHQLANLNYLSFPDSLEKSLELYKKSLYLNPEKSSVRYNYELLKRIAKEKERESPAPKQSTKNTPSPKKEPIQSPKKIENDFLEAISNQEQEQMRKYQLKKAKKAKNNEDLPNW